MLSPSRLLEQSTNRSFTYRTSAYLTQSDSCPVFDDLVSSAIIAKNPTCLIASTIAFHTDATQMLIMSFWYSRLLQLKHLCCTSLNDSTISRQEVTHLQEIASGHWVLPLIMTAEWQIKFCQKLHDIANHCYILSVFHHFCLVCVRDFLLIIYKYLLIIFPSCVVS